MATIASLKVNILGDSTALSNSLKSATDKMQAFGDKATAIGQNLSTKLTLPIVGAGALMVKAFMTQEDAVAKMTAALRANGGQAGTTAKEIQDLASNLQKVTTFGDEVTISAASLLLTFHQVRNEVGKGNDVFNRTIKASQDLASVLGIDLQSSTMQLAKALENPTIGLGALSRSGTTFTEQQKEMIKTLVDSGRQLEAQTMILDVVESQYAGIAESMRKTTSGTIKAAVNELGDEMEAFGKIISEALIPFINSITDAVRFISKLDESTKRLIVNISAFVAVIGPAILAVGVLTTSINLLTIAMAKNPYTFIAIAILSIATAAYAAAKGVNTLEKAQMRLAGVDTLTGSEEERVKLREREKEITDKLTLANERLRLAQSRVVRETEQDKIDKLKEEAGVIDQLLAKSNALAWQTAELENGMREASEASEALKKGLSGTTTAVVHQAGSTDALGAKLKELQAEMGATGDSIRRAQLAHQIRVITSEIERLEKMTEPVEKMAIGIQKLSTATFVRGQLPLAELPQHIKDMNNALEQSSLKTEVLDFSIKLAKDSMMDFTNLAIQGFADLVVSGGKVVDMLENIGKMVLSGAIQLLLKYGLFGAVGLGSTAKGASRGLIGGLFAGSASMGNMGGVTPASASLTLDGQFQIRGTDLVYVMNRAERSLR